MEEANGKEIKMCCFSISQVIVAVGILFTGSIFTLITYVSFVLWVSTGVAVAALLRLRQTKPDLPRPIKVHLSLPVIYVICSILLIGFSIYEEPVNTGNVLFILKARGIPFFSVLFYLTSSVLNYTFIAGIGALITLTGIPAYYLGKVLSVSRSVTIFFQKIMNVIPQEKSETLL